jgi:hypothetical protein
MPPETFDVALSLAQKGGAYCSPLLLLGLLWLARDRQRIIDDGKAKDARILDLAERTITVATELKTYLFNERRAGGS